MRMFAPDKTQEESERGEYQEISEELHEDAALEMTFSDMRPVGGKRTLKGDHVQRASRKCFSLEYEEIQKQYDIQDQEYDTTYQEALAERLADTWCIPGTTTHNPYSSEANPSRLSHSR